MHLTIFHILAFASCFFGALARNSHRSFLKRNPGIIGNLSALYGDSVDVTKRDSTKYVFMHHIVGNTYSYTAANWKADISTIQAHGVDALALNIGGDSWQITQVSNAYAAALALGTGFKLFISFDFTAYPCSTSNVVSLASSYVNHPNQFKVGGQSMISSYEGGCLGNSGWASIKAQTNGYVMPFISGLEGSFNQWPALNSWLCWGCAWPQGDNDINTNADEYYLSQLGSRYATTVSVWQYTHFSYKNWYQRGDDFLLNARWEELFSLRDQLTFVEMITWNDAGESDYFGSLAGNDLPAGTTWTNGFNHMAFFDMSQYYITAFKTGSYPAITSDVMYYWARPNPANATATSDPLPRPSGYNWAEDNMWAVAFATSQATVILQCGSSSATFTVTPGVNKLQIPLSPGQMTVKMIRNGQTIIDQTAQGYTFSLTPALYNFNAWVGSATATAVSNPTPTSMSSTKTTTTTSSTPAASMSSTKTTTTTSSTPPATTTAGGTSWTYQGCYKDDSTRIINNGPYSSSTQTVESCLARCHSGGYSFAGVEYGVQCFCSSSLRSNAVKTADTACSQQCSGNASEKCGGVWLINVYEAK